jgi:hypothetical protein
LDTATQELHNASYRREVKHVRAAVLIPCYNEAKTIRKVISEFRAALPSAKIYVYDNNSRDDTAAIAAAAVPLFAGKCGKAKEMLSGGCSLTSTQICLYSRRRWDV